MIFSVILLQVVWFVAEQLWTANITESPVRHSKNLQTVPTDLENN